MHVVEAAGCQAENVGFEAGIQRFEGGTEFRDDKVQQHACEAADAEVVQRVEEYDCCVVSVEVWDGGERWREDGVRHDEVEQGGFASAGGVVGWGRGDEFEDCW